MKKINVAIDAARLESKRTGVERYLMNLLQEFRKHSDHFDFTLFFKNSIPVDDFLQDSAFKKIIVKAPGFMKGRFPWNFSTLPRAVSKVNADVFFSPFYNLPFVKNVKSVVTIHDISYETHPEWFDWRRRLGFKIFSKSGVRRADKVLAVSKFSANEVQEHYNTPSEKIVVTYEAADKIFQPVDVLQNDIKEKMEIRGPFLLYLCSMFNRRHPDSVIRAFRLIAKKYPDMKLVMVGKNQTNPYIDLDKLIEDLGLSSKVIWEKGHVAESDLVKLYSAAEISLYPSDYEGFGLPVVEAMQCGCPVITSSGTSLDEVAVGAAHTLDVITDKTLSDAVFQIIENEEYKQSLIIKGFERAKQFSWEKCAKDTLEVFKSVVSS